MMPPPTSHLFTHKGTTSTLTIDGEEIFFRPCQSLQFELLSIKDKKNYLSLLEQVQIDPRGILEEVKALENKGYGAPEIDNLITYVLIQNRCIDEAEKRIIRSFEQYPEYFFAKINYGDYLLRKKDLNGFKRIFPYSTLKEYFPEKTLFHVHEYRSFYLLMCTYYLCRKDTKTARIHFHKALQADPTHPTVIAREKTLPKPFRQHATELMGLLKRISLKK